ncbi:MAG: hypothetical protein ACREJB_07470, partial [Planctomycetaceae bacterium]
MLSLGLVAAVCSTLPACAPLRSGPVSNPLFVPAANQEAVWERTVDVLHDYPFAIERENKLDGVIATEYKVGSGVLEPWHEESVGAFNRWESTLQSVRRKVLVNIVPTDGGYLVGVEAHKELEDVTGLVAGTPGGATFQESTPLQRDLDLVVGQSRPSGWIPVGRDLPLEHDLLLRLQDAYA